MTRSVRSRSRSGPRTPRAGAAGAENQQSFAGEGDAEIALEIGAEPYAVGVVAEQGRILEERNRIHGLSPFPRAA